MSDFSLKLSDDQIGIQSWVHGFAEDVVRPAAEEWDEKEEFPYPIVQQAAESGLYGWEFMAEMMSNDPTGLTMPVAIVLFDIGKCLATTDIGIFIAVDPKPTPIKIPIVKVK